MHRFGLSHTLFALNTCSSVDFWFLTLGSRFWRADHLLVREVHVLGTVLTYLAQMRKLTLPSSLALLALSTRVGVCTCSSQLAYG